MLRISSTNTKPKKKWRFHFTNSKEWEREVNRFETTSNYAPTDESEGSKSLSDLLSLVVNEFVESWFSKLSTSTLFAEDVRHELSHIVLKGLGHKLRKLDYAKLITLKFLPSLNKQYRTFIEVQNEDVAETLSRFKDLHVGVTVDQPGMAETNFQEKTYLRGQMKKLVAMLSSDGEKDNEIVLMFMTEVLACTILDNVVNLITDSDFINVQVVKFVGDSLKRRNQVKELRSALEETMSSVSAGRNDDDSTGDTEMSLLEIFVQSNDQTVVHRAKEGLEMPKLAAMQSTDSDENVVDQIDEKLATIMSDERYSGVDSSIAMQDAASDLNKAVFNRKDRYSKLFEDEEESEDDEESDGLGTDSDSVILKEGSESMELAGPGNLNLAERIPQIEREIESLQRQLIYLEPLIRKAQLTNNQSKLKVLLKSKNGVQKDITFKELQKQQYIVQESDNSLFGKSKVTILSVVHQNEKGKEFVLYIIEVQKFSTEDPNVVKAGWVVARRYSQFYRLHGYLKRRYPQVSSLSFPQKSLQVLKFQQKNITDSRRRQLEAYLRALIEIPEVCSDMAFRSFLSSENFQLGKQRFDEPKKLSAMFGYRWYLGSSGNKALVYDQYSSTPSDANGEILENRREMEKELLQFDEKTTSKPLFIKPICDIIITIFNLHWLRGRALVVILQQVFGRAVENKVYEVIHSHLNESSVCNWSRLLREQLFPNGKFQLEPVVRTLEQRQQTQREAKQLFDTFMSETCSKVFGSENTANAATTLFLMLQINQLNKHLLFQFLDEILEELCNQEGD